jgi:hypothetical protein
MRGASDKGLYQVYAHHPVYGKNLVYIGMTQASFAARIPVNNWEGGAENDPKRVEYYLGRLRGIATPSSGHWNEEIRLAEALLIHAHAPAYSRQFVIDPPGETTHGHVRVLNWGAVRSLHREVSGLMWTNRARQFLGYQIYGAAPPGR